ncbi:YwaF family protein [Cohnella nanjingensis]|uniref:TIGR02206 family membrane protein n=1 Tax=Cohnella nanjingensis TaxID=1387779 RepID=A0A7X0RPT3_9BACL|nr:TIGR02206 family membrane protein [Cohnella nanjingensis]MBB6671433.1 TIGR02206 family membrane protein [Cohnella nanjingensis]
MAFEAYSLAHLAALAAVAASIAAIIGFRGRLRTPKVKRTARAAFVAAVVVCEGAMLVRRAWTNDWGFEALPFELCSLMIWLSAAAVWTGNKRLYELTFFLGILGAAQALLTPDLNVGFPDFLYFHFFFGHLVIVAANVYMTAAEGYRPTRGSIWRAWIGLHALAIPAAIADRLWGTNFMFLARKPPGASLLDLLGPWPWYLLQLEVVAVALMLLLYGAVLLADRLHGRHAGSLQGGGQR